MALCASCHNIPFGSLPDPPCHEGFYRLADEDEMPWIIYPRPADPLGFPWHPDLDALALSAGSCTFCDVIQNAVESWLQRLEAVRNEPSFLEFYGTHGIPNGSRLWITGRYHGVPGILVFVRNPQDLTYIYLLAGVSFAVDAENPSADTLKLRPLDLDSGSPYSLDIAADFLQTCHRDHEYCIREPSSLPSRLLDVGKGGNVIKLVDTGGEVGEYASLSYCWGQAPHFTTTRESMEARRAGIRPSDLPKTCLDAITITRHLGLRYLWIDALCICQDDTEEWARESTRDVYSGAHVVIAATRASDKADGCFHIRTPRRTGKVDLPGYASDVHVRSIFNSETMSWAPGSFGTDPLSQRAWALQERVLARRVIHYTESQIYFECNHGIVGEDGHCYEDRYLDINRLRHATESRYWPVDDKNLWIRLLWEYGERKLTRPTDKFPAMTGLAKIFEKRLQAQYVAGLWSTDMIRGLAWQGLGDRRPQARSPDQYIAPSWSWASYAGVAAQTWRVGLKFEVAAIIDWEVRLKTETNPYGELLGAWLRVHAPIRPLIPSRLETTDLEIRLRRACLSPLPRLQTSYDDGEEGTKVIFDYDETKENGLWKKMNLYVLIVGQYPLRDATKRTEASSEKDEGGDIGREGVADGNENEDDDDGYYFSLVVQPVDNGKPEDGMRRVGWMFLTGSEGTKVKDDPSNWKTVKLF